MLTIIANAIYNTINEIKQQYLVDRLSTGSVGLKMEYGDGQAGPCMGRCMGGAWHGDYLDWCGWTWGLGAVLLVVMVVSYLVWYRAHYTCNYPLPTLMSQKS